MYVLDIIIYILTDIPHLYNIQLFIEFYHIFNYIILLTRTIE